MLRSLKTQFSMSIASLILFTVAVISLLSNVFINQKFKSYITEQQKQKNQELASNLSKQYIPSENYWNKNFIHVLGMNALYDGYIIRVYDNKGIVVWDAKKHDMTLCTQVMADISERMQAKYPRINGEFVSKDFDLVQNGEKIGKVAISYFGPYFLNENDFQFLTALNTILAGIGGISLISSLVIGWLMAKRISDPITKIVDIAGQISKGDYSTRFKGKTNIKELNALIFSINHLALSLNDQEDLRKQLTADVAHELRTPLTTIGTHLEAMIEGVWEPTQDRLQSCYEEMSRLTALVKDLERLAKIESDNLKLQKEPIYLIQLVRNVSSNFEIELQNKKLNLTVEGTQGIVQADKDRLRQVVLNLLSNAIKYTKENGHILIQVVETESLVELIIEDDGIGISIEELPFVFERFYRADKSRNRKTGGAGIGLAIVKSIVAAHGGTVEVKSQLGKGSKFLVKLPKI